LLFFTILGVSFSFQDSDLDGVPDELDKCPNTPFFTIVDEHGCPVKEIPVKRKNWKLYLKLGFSHARDNDYESNSLSYSLAFSYRRVYLSYTVRYYTFINGIGSGWGSSSLYASYRKFFKNTALYAGLRLSLPTGDKEISGSYANITPSLFFNYFKGKWDLSLYAERTFRSNPERRDTWLFSAGAGYAFSPDVYVNLSFDFAESSLRPVYNNYLNLFLYYNLKRWLYFTLNLSKGLSPYATDRSLTFKVGLRF